MIQTENTRLSYDYMGVFTGDEGWVHPRVCIDTHELIFVSEGTVYIEEDGVHYTLRRGDYILLSPALSHGGFAASECKTVFTWLHLQAEGFSALGIPKTGHTADVHRAEYRLREIGHLAKCGAERAYLETEILSLLFGFKYEALPEGSKLCAEAAEYIRVHIAENPSAADIAKKFGYSPDHLSRLFGKFYHLSLKEYIDEMRITLIRNALLLKNASVKEIAAECGFEDGNRLSKFFKYHTGKTPSEYRAQFFDVHTNIQ